MTAHLTNMEYRSARLRAAELCARLAQMLLDGADTNFDPEVLALREMIALTVTPANLVAMQSRIAEQQLEIARLKRELSAVRQVN